MKVHCDVCDQAPATVMCCADEAALCSDCDTRVHAANKLASKHQRLPLLPPDSPSCDICQEKTGYFFCLEDRALLCRSCDFSIHSANALASNHKRFLVTGVRVALQSMSGRDRTPAPEIVQASSPAQTQSPRMSTVFNAASTAVSQQVPSLSSGSGSVHAVTPGANSGGCQRLDTSAAQKTASRTMVAPKIVAAPPVMSPAPVHVPPGKSPLDWGVRPNVPDVRTADLGFSGVPPQKGGGGGFVRRSSISEYLTETIPGWRVDELLNPPDMAAIYGVADSGSSKTDTPSFGDLDWAAELSALDEQILGESPAEVPSIPSPPTASGVPRSGRYAAPLKGKRRSDVACFFGLDDALVVPDTGGQSSPTPSPTSPLKRRRFFPEDSSLCSC